MQHRVFPRPRLLLPAILVLSLSLPASGEKPRFAVVDVAKAFEAYHVTQEEKEKNNNNAARAELKKDKRLEQIKLTRVELLDLRENVRDTTLSEAQREEYFRKFQIKAHELRSLQRDTLNYLAEQKRIIDTAMVDKTKELLETIRSVVREISEEGGYDYVFEKGGKTSSQIAPLIYIRNATDLTDLVIKTLNKDAPPEKAVATVENP